MLVALGAPRGVLNLARNMERKERASFLALRLFCCSLLEAEFFRSEVASLLALKAEAVLSEVASCSLLETVFSALAFDEMLYLISFGSSQFALQFYISTY